MRIPYKEIASGLHDGEVVWICDYRFEDVNNKPIRLVRPKQVLVRSNQETKKKVYYSASHFIPWNNGKPKKSEVIKLFDNTGFRACTGTPLNVFTDLGECISCFIGQIDKARLQIGDWYQAQLERYEKLEADLDNEIRALQMINPED